MQTSDDDLTPADRAMIDRAWERHKAAAPDLPGVWAALDHDAVEEYIRALSWSNSASDWDKTIVAGNIRAFASHVRDLAKAVSAEGE